MKLSEFKASLAQHPERPLRFVLPDGAVVPAHAHVTEVARVDKHFVDCGGTQREERYCRLQTWVAHDLDHRLHAGKLLKILDKAHSLLGPEDLEVDVEHEVAVISQYPLTAAQVCGAELHLHLGTRHTACLAPELCCPPPAEAQPISFNFSPRKP